MSLREEFTDSMILSKFLLCRRSQELERPRYIDEKVVRQKLQTAVRVKHVCRNGLDEQWFDESVRDS